MDERTLKVYWALCPGLEPSSYRRLMRHFGSASNLHQAEASEWCHAARLQNATVESMRRWQSRSDELIERAVRNIEKAGVYTTVQGDDDYPQRLYDLFDPPIVLFARGDTRILHLNHLVAVVGTRRASSYGLEVTRWLCTTLVEYGVGVVSGMALGIDGCAHEATLSAKGDTLSVLGCGVDVCYPPSHQSLYERIHSAGLLISEYAPRSLAAKHRFPERNRLIAALSNCTVVVQAGQKSGALRTCESAMEIGRDVYVVPGPITSKSFRGSHELLSDGAIPLIDPERLIVDLMGDSRQKPIAHRTIPDHLSKWIELLQEEGPLRAGELAHISASSPAHVYAALLELELGGLLERMPDGRYIVAANR